ncbi:hypothetical protein Tsp_03120 [Trichinella spiralis]|uniref:hypothetical protein n=1 Tax=Trichinella spiralis TaxID=6334 RepID=UPI0001EFBBCB|nr:hypothetical protein Tsp_03120 [Trichinella spiralis]
MLSCRLLLQTPPAALPFDLGKQNANELQRSQLCNMNSRKICLSFFSSLKSGHPLLLENYANKQADTSTRKQTREVLFFLILFDNYDDSCPWLSNVNAAITKNTHSTPLNIEEQNNNHLTTPRIILPFFFNQYTALL